MASYIANDMRVGWVIAHNGKRYSVTSITKVKPGKGGAFVQADLRDIDSGNKGGDRWRAEDKVEKLTERQGRSFIMLSNFPYIKIPEFNGDIKADIESLLKSNNKQKTFDHVVAVAKTNVQIAERYGLDNYICELSGYLHDISAVIKLEDMLKYAVNNNFYIDEAERRHPFLLHQRMSRIIAFEDFGITEELILSAVECHSTLKMRASEYDMALFVADKLSWDKEGIPPFYDVVKSKLDISLKEASLAYMQYIVENKMILYPHKWFNEAMAELFPTG